MYIELRIAADHIIVHQLVPIVLGRCMESADDDTGKSIIRHFTILLPMVTVTFKKLVVKKRRSLLKELTTRPLYLNTALLKYGKTKMIFVARSPLNSQYFSIF